jgi:hypothetical protein
MNQEKKIKELEEKFKDNLKRHNDANIFSLNYIHSRLDSQISPSIIICTSILISLIIVGVMFLAFESPYSSECIQYENFTNETQRVVYVYQNINITNLSIVYSRPTCYYGKPCELKIVLGELNDCIYNNSLGECSIQWNNKDHTNSFTFITIEPIIQQRCVKEQQVRYIKYENS